MAFAEGRCKRSCVWMLLSFLLLSHAMAYPTSTSVPDSSPSPSKHTTSPPPWKIGQVIRGPCAEGEWLVLEALPTANSSPAQQPRLRGRCTREPCPEGQVLYEGGCFVRTVLEAALCGGFPINIGPTGYWEGCRREYPVAVAVGSVECAQKDGGGCEKDVESSANIVIIQPED